MTASRSIRVRSLRLQQNLSSSLHGKPGSEGLTGFPGGTALCACAVEDLKSTLDSRVVTDPLIYDELQHVSMCVCRVCVRTYKALVDGVMAENSLFISLFPFRHKLQLSDWARDDLAYRIALAYYRGDGIRTLKGSWTFWSAKALRNDPAPIDFPPFLYSGVFGARIKKLMQADRWRFDVGQAFLVAKRATAVVDEIFVKGALEETRAKLCETLPGEEPDWFRREVERTVQEVFGGSNFLDQLRNGSMLVPSMRACMDISGGCPQARANPIYDQGVRHKAKLKLKASCKRLGLDYGVIVRTKPQWDKEKRQFKVPTDFLPTRASRIFHWQDLARLLKCIQSRDVVAVGGRNDTLGTLGLFHRFVDEHVSVSMNLADDEFIRFLSYRDQVIEIRDKRFMVYDHLDEFLFRGVDAELENPFCKAVPVRESFKVRVITKGPARLQYYGRFIQKFLWSTAKRNSAFRLIGGSVTPHIMSKFFSRCHPGFRIVSGDYKAATDNIQKFASERTIDAICEQSHVPTYIRELMYAIMTRHKFVWGRTDEVADQTNGQLMGSVISFVILCLINAAAIRYAIESSCRLAYESLYNRFTPLSDSELKFMENLEKRCDVSLSEMNILINGDDCLFELPNGPEGDVDYYYRHWQNVMASVGLKMSVGKNYIADDFAVINSRMFRPERLPLEDMSLLCDWSFVEHDFELVEQEVEKNGVVYTELTKVPSAKIHRSEDGSTTLHESGQYLVRSNVVHFVNPGLVMGVGRVAGGDEEGELADEGPTARAWRLWDDCHPNEVNSVYEDLYLRFNSDLLKELAHPLQSWFLPRYCGGLGLPPPRSFTIDKVSPPARSVMRGLLNEADPTRSLSLFKAEMPTFVQVGTERINEISNKLGIKPKLVHIWQYNQYVAGNKDAYAQTYFPYMYHAGVTDGEQCNNFAKLVNRFRKVTPGDSLPSFERSILVPGLELLARNDMMQMLTDIGTPSGHYTQSLRSSVPAAFIDPPEPSMADDETVCRLG